MKFVSKSKKNLSVIIVLLLLFSFVSCALLKPNPRYYIALGDSVPSGYGLESPEESYPSVFYELIKDNDYIDEYKNLAVGGYTAAMLLEMLENMGSEELNDFENAQIITLNIGGNNILIPFLEYLKDLKIKTGAEDIKTGTGNILTEIEELIYVIIAEAEKTSSGSDEAKSGLSDFISKLHGIVSELFHGILTTIDGAWNVLLGTPEAVATFSGSFTPELKKKLDNSIETFSEEFIKIITWVETYAPRADIIVNTVYNPIPREVFGLSLELSNLANAYIESINSTIITESRVRGCILIDIYTNLTNQTDMMNLNLDPFEGNVSFDIHPNNKGHELIAQLNYKYFMQHVNNKKE